MRDQDVVLLMQQEHDQRKALLSECLSKVDTDRIIAQLAEDFEEAEDMGEKLFAHAALVGVIGTMLDDIETARGGKA